MQFTREPGRDPPPAPWRGWWAVFAVIAAVAVGVGHWRDAHVHTSLSGAQLATARTQLAALPIRAAVSTKGYSRLAFGAPWTDAVEVADGDNGCDTRDDILHRDLTGVTTKPGTNGCEVRSGTLADPYTGHTIHFVRGKRTSSAIQIDHVVALGNVWVTGGQDLTDDQRQDLANDPRELLAVDGPANQTKGDADAAGWLPPDRDSWCAYVAIQIGVKTDYRLWTTPAEHRAMARVLGGCRPRSP